MPAPTLISTGAVGAYTATSGASFTPTFPTGGIQLNDIMVMWAHVSSNGALATAPLTGWTKLSPSGVSEDNTIAQHVEVWWKRAGASESSPALTLASNAVTIVRGGKILAVRGCPTVGDPFAGQTRLNTATSAVVATTSMTPSEGNTLNLFLIAYEDDPNLASQPAGGWSTVTVEGSTLGNDCALNFASLTQGTAAALNPSTTVSGGSFANSPCVGILLSLKGLPGSPSSQAIWLA